MPTFSLSKMYLEDGMSCSVLAEKVIIDCEAISYVNKG